MTMPHAPLRRWTQDTLREARMNSAMGRAAESADAFYPDFSTPAAQADFISYLIDQINALNAVAVRLAAEIDAVRGA